jgi:PAS domain S-box-containing protein/putative nucleotidyltransferase with HDIG domain
MSLRILLVEDDANDAELALRRLREAGLEPDAHRVATPGDLAQALTTAAWDIALVDYNLPGFSGLEALQTIAELAPDLPAITVSGAISEEMAVATITAGAVDYVLKDNLTRLAPAVQRALEAAELRRQQRLAAAQAQKSKFAVDHASQAIVYISEDGAILYANHAAEWFGGVPRDEVVGQRIWSWAPMIDERRWAELWRLSAEQPIVGFEAPVRLPDGRERLVKATVDHMTHEDGDFVIVYVRDVTDEKAAEERARETEERYRRLADNLHDIVFRFDVLPEPRLSFVSRAVETMLGYTQDECCARPELLLQVDDSGAMPRPADLLNSADPDDEPLLVRRNRDGAPQWLEFRTVAVRDGDDQLAAVEGIVRDVTARRQAEEDLRFTQFVVEHAGDAVYWMEADGHLRYANPAACRALGYELDEFRRMTIHDFGHKVPPERWPAHMRELKEAGSLTFESIHRRKDGSTIPTEVTATHLEHDGVAYNVSFARDISERKRAEEELKHSRDLLDYVVRHARTGIAILDRDLRYVYESRLYHEQWGIDAGDIIGKTPYDVFVDLPADWRAIYERALGGEVVSGECDPYPRADGSTDWMRWKCRPWFEPDGAIGGIIVYAEKITERVEAETALRESEERYRAMFEKNRAIKLLIDAETSAIVDANQAAVDFYGYTREQLCSLRVADLNTLPPDEIRTMLAGIGAEEVSQFVFKHRLASGEIRDVEVNSGPIVVKGRTLLFSIIQDVTERRVAEDAIRTHAARLRRTVEGSVTAMGQIVESRDPYTAGHERRVSELAVAVGAQMGLDPPSLEGLRLAALIHDIGKVSVPAEILARPGRLSEVEFSIIKQHAQSGYEILAPIDFDQPVARIVLQHHERLDGSGYPQGLRGDQIMPQARILALADVVEAMSSHRPYRPSLGMEAALDEVSRGAGVVYDAAVAAACVRVVREKGFAFDA